MYQTMSNDNMVSTSIRKSNQPNFKSNKEDHQSCAAENGRIAASTTTSTTTTNLLADGLLSPPTTTTTTTQNQHQQIAFNPSNSSNQTAAAASSSSAAANHEMFLQWGPRKRSRCARTEARSIVSAVLEKQHQTTTSIVAAAAAAANHVMPPPHPNPNLPSTSNGNRSGTSTRVRPHNLLYSKDTPAFPPSKNRNIVDQMGTNSGSPSRNDGGGGSSSRPISRSAVGKRSPSCIDKNDNHHHNNNNSKKICSTSGGIRKVKSDDSLTPNTNTATNGNGGNHVDAHGEHEHGGGGGGGGGGGVSMVCSPVTDAEKGGELVEWPRIFISLSRKEKEDDFYAMKGTKLPHRPKKRAKAVDRALQYCFPGLWLSDLTRARYEVRERKSAKKQPKRRGLKGLETMESDSE